MLIGGGGKKKTLRLVARHADIWHSFGNPEAVERKASILRQHSAEYACIRIMLLGLRASPKPGGVYLTNGASSDLAAARSELAPYG